MRGLQGAHFGIKTNICGSVHTIKHNLDMCVDGKLQSVWVRMCIQRPDVRVTLTVRLPESPPDPRPEAPGNVPSLLPPSPTCLKSPALFWASENSSLCLGFRCSQLSRAELMLAKRKTSLFFKFWKKYDLPRLPKAREKELQFSPLV